MRSYYIYFIIGLLCALSRNGSAQINLPSIFSDGMILQQQSSVKIWGKTLPGSEIRLFGTWNNLVYSVKVKKDSTWQTTIMTPNAGGPYEIHINNGSSLVLKDILIGEVWLASGQSNMEMPLKGFKDQPICNSKKYIAEANNNFIRFFNIENLSWKMPLDNCKGKWLISTQENSPKFSATAYLFALNLYNFLRVPVGIIESDWGGTPIEAWMNADQLSKYSEIVVPKNKNISNIDKKTPSGLYNAMIHPILGYGIKGFIWYQGEQNRNNPQLYKHLFPDMVKQWRHEWGIKNLPFYYAQIAPFLYSQTTELPEKVRLMKPKIAYLREAQLKSESKIKNSGMAVLMDVGDETTIHPSDKQTVADRLFYLAKAKTYGIDETNYSGPVYAGIKKKKNKIFVHFKCADGLYFKGDNSENFEIAGLDQIFYPANVEIKDNKVIVCSDKVNKPVAVRYAFKAWAKGDLYNSAGLPASSFRSDKWNIPHQ